MQNNKATPWAFHVPDNPAPRVRARVLSRRSRVRLFATPWTVARYSALSMGLSRQESWSGLPFPLVFYVPRNSSGRESALTPAGCPVPAVPSCFTAPPSLRSSSCLCRHPRTSRVEKQASEPAAAPSWASCLLACRSRASCDTIPLPFKLEDNCFTMLHSFLLYNEVDQLYVYLHRLPPIPPPAMPPL